MVPLSMAITIEIGEGYKSDPMKHDNNDVSLIHTMCDIENWFYAEILWVMLETL